MSTSIARVAFVKPTSVATCFRWIADQPWPLMQLARTPRWRFYQDVKPLTVPVAVVVVVWKVVRSQAKPVRHCVPMTRCQAWPCHRRHPRPLHGPCHRRSCLLVQRMYLCPSWFLSFLFRRLVHQRPCPSLLLLQPAAAIAPLKMARHTAKSTSACRMTMARATLPI